MGGIERDGPNTKACAVYYKDALIGFTIQGTGKDGQSEMDIMWLKSNIKTSLDQMQKEAELKAQEEAEALRDVKAAEEAESEENDKAEEADEDKSSEEDTKAE
jgi:hypothetical protein